MLLFLSAKYLNNANYTALNTNTLKKTYEIYFKICYMHIYIYIFQIYMYKGVVEIHLESEEFGSVAQSCLTLWDPMDCSMPGLSVHHQLLEFTQTHVHWIGDTIQPSHPLSSPSPDLNLSQHQGLFKLVRSSHQVAKVLELQLQHQSFQWIIRDDFF